MADIDIQLLQRLDENIKNADNSLRTMQKTVQNWENAMNNAMQNTTSNFNVSGFAQAIEKELDGVDKVFAYKMQSIGYRVDTKMNNITANILANFAKIRADIGQVSGIANTSQSSSDLMNYINNFQQLRDSINRSGTAFQNLEKYADILTRFKALASEYSTKFVDKESPNGTTIESELTKIESKFANLQTMRLAGILDDKQFETAANKILDKYDELIKRKNEFEKIGDIATASKKREDDRAKALKTQQRNYDEIKKREAELNDIQRRHSVLEKKYANETNVEIKAKLKDVYDAEEARIKTLQKEIRQLKNERVDAAKISGVSNNSKTSKGSIDAANSKRELDSKRRLLDATKRLEEAEAAAAEKRRQQSLQAARDFNTLTSTVRKLAAALGMTASLQGLTNFGRKLIEVRGEFEMQFVAMKQIIQDTDAATKIWNQTMQQALQSPFRAMQLVDYTKKLAAYRIETDKLFDTTKRLADVSAGLGVDMGRLILAYGQVKAANFLRASEVRQFTEAGVNVVGELANYFSQIENRAVSTSDVMERITKRMVLFSDVEAIFKRITDEGGIFYNMQEVQADTVRGQIMKLHDAYDQMLNTIGEANQGAIREWIERLIDLVKHWRDVSSFIWKNINALVVLMPLIASYRRGVKLAAGETYTWSRAGKELSLTFAFAKKGLRELITEEKLATAAMYILKGATDLLKTAFRTFVPFLAIEGLMLLITKMGESSRAAEQLKNDLDNVGSRNVATLQENIDGFADLYDRLKKATEGSSEYLDIRNKIQNQYGEYLDNLDAEAITVDNLANAYDRVVERMREKSRQHIIEEGMQEITKVYSDSFINFAKSLAGTKVGNTKLTLGDAQNIAKKMYDLYSKNPAENDVNKLFLTALQEYGLSGTVSGRNYSERYEFFKAIKQRYENQIELETKANALTEAKADTHQEYLDQLALEEQHERNIANIRKKKQSDEKTDYELSLEKIRFEEKRLELRQKYEKKSEDWLKKEKAKLRDNYGEFLNAYNKQVDAYISSKYGSDWRNKDTKEAFSDYTAMIANQDRLSQGQSKWEEQIIGNKKLIEENIKRIKEELATTTAKDSEANKKLSDSLKEEEHKLELVKKQMELLGLHEKDKSKGSYSNNGIYGDRIRLLQDMLQKYRQAAKEAYGFAKAEEKTGQSFEDAWNSIMPAGYGELEVPTSYAALTEMLQRLEAFTPQFDKNGKLSKMMADLKKAIADALSNVDIEMSVNLREDFARDMEEMFSDYELTLELQGLNIPKDAAKDLFPDFDFTTLGQIQERMQKFYNDNIKVDESGHTFFDKDDLEVYRKWADKIDAEILKSRKEKTKQYSKFLEQEYSERAKLEMQYVSDIAFVRANVSDETQRKNIEKNINDKFNKELNELNWKSFKESSFYIEMMDDLSSIPAEYMKTMLGKIEEILQHPETLSPRALKEAINARQKIIEAQMDYDQIAVMRESMREINKAMAMPDGSAESGVGGRNWKETKKNLDKEMAKKAEDLKLLEKQIEDNKALQGQIKAVEDATEAVDIAKSKLSTTTVDALKTVKDESELYNQYKTELDDVIKNTDEFSAKKETTPEEKDENAKNEKRIRELEAILPLLNDYIKAREKQKEVESTTGGAAGRKALDEGTTSTSIGRIIAEKEEDKENIVNRISLLKKWQKSFENFNESFKKFNDNAADMVNRLNSLAVAANDVYEALGGETNALTEGWKEFGNTMTNVITEVLTMIPKMVEAFATAGTTINAAMGIIGLIAEAVQLLLVAITAVSKLHDAGYEKEIEIQKDKIDELSDAYSRLERQIKRTFTVSEYVSDYNDMLENINAQIAAIEAQREAERDKKNSDEDAIREYNNQINDLKDQLEDLEDELRDTFGGIGKDNYRSWAEGFVSAWKDAFLETGNGLDALQKHFDEFLQEWFVKQAVMAGASSLLEPVINEINKAIDPNYEGGSRVTYNELERVKEIFGNQKELLDDFLTSMSEIGYFDNEGSLSGLAAGIQGMTEEKANILEAYWNSVRNYTASIDTNVAQIANMLGAGGANTNPMLEAIRANANNTSKILNILDSVTRGGHTKGGLAIKIIND